MSLSYVDVFRLEREGLFRELAGEKFPRIRALIRRYVVRTAFRSRMAHRQYASKVLGDSKVLSDSESMDEMKRSYSLASDQSVSRCRSLVADGGDCCGGRGCRG
jgi:hypothetical protein